MRCRTSGMLDINMRAVMAVSSVAVCGAVEGKAHKGPTEHPLITQY